MSDPDRRRRGSAHLTDPALRERALAAAREALQSPEVQARTREYLMSDRNPFRNPLTRGLIRAKAMEASRAIGYARLDGGNGTGLTAAQAALASKIGWPTEYIVPTGERGKGIPTHYKLDLAEPAAKIAVELDGQSHRGLKVQAADRRKEAWLRERGWTVVRFANAEILADVGAVVRQLTLLAHAAKNALGKE
jgi:hypothetical protein